MARLTIFTRRFRCTGPLAHLFHAMVEINHNARTESYSPYRRDLDYDSDARHFASAPPPMPLPICPDCSYSAEDADRSLFSRNNAQVAEAEASAVAVRVNPDTGREEFSYCFDRPDRPLPAGMRDMGYAKVQFRHYRDMERHCRRNNLVNNIETDTVGGLAEINRSTREAHEARVRAANEAFNVMRAEAIRHGVWDKLRSAG